MGIAIALTILLLWTGHLVYSLLFVHVDPASPALYVHIAVQAYLSTGLFITAHDAMHGTVSASARINRIAGTVCCWLYACLSYSRLLHNHRLHHKSPGGDADPDYSPRSQNFFIWWFTFMRRYATVRQIAGMAIVYNLLHLRFSDLSLWTLWVLPLILSTAQLFYFGTYQPHRPPHTEAMKPHNTRTLGRNHAWAMLSCYFFGYHREHHESPKTPWWRLYALK